MMIVICTAVTRTVGQSPPHPRFPVTGRTGGWPQRLQKLKLPRGVHVSCRRCSNLNHNQKHALRLLTLRLLTLQPVFESSVPILPIFSYQGFVGQSRLQWNWWGGKGTYT